MDKINPEFIEKYQIIFHNDPTSKVFAPLAEAYRKMGLIKEALQVAQTGVRRHPEFPSGRVALARILTDLGQNEKALEHLQAAVTLAPENLLAYQLLAQLYLKLKQPKMALKAYKMLLFLNPNDQRAQEGVAKLESLTADEYDADVFKMHKMTAAPVTQPLTPPEPRPADLERSLSLADAFMIRQDFESANRVLTEAEAIHGARPELKKRFTLLRERSEDVMEVEIPSEKVPSRAEITQQVKIDYLQSLLNRISNRKHPAT